MPNSEIRDRFTYPYFASIVLPAFQNKNILIVNATAGNNVRPEKEMSFII